VPFAELCRASGSTGSRGPPFTVADCRKKKKKKKEAVDEDAVRLDQAIASLSQQMR
jgi:hypothetical protein